MISKARSTIFAAAITAALLLVLFLIAGCGGGGKKTNELTSPWNGTISGIATEPPDEDTDVALDSWIHVYWPDENFPPPPSFTVRLEKEIGNNEWSTVRTVYKSQFSDSEGGSWWFEPSSEFSPNTWYRIVVRDDDRRTYTSVFLTTGVHPSVASGAKSATALKKYRPSGAENAAPSGEAGEEEHTITTRK